ncbi:branched-chain amino acid ABC transporter permease [Aeromicrobium chenweiae]|uniref:Branched-chain amino acid ABC transporter permease n=1 Tax=Aeromicrobium chenweiae TaxID=2079793 RepID=A0A2S0WRG0_9ACTN|nr:branched-chain amino acid ABC transporter permease [Aeromicrobium chenweiae]AWB93943.1 branched-chain amino acid ABC transporter permease [Aeromicrobium chenweiae]TGN30991.1 branched-chain amino acid ABC transporter permease [Aeromicrobium chenweiae]
MTFFSRHTLARHLLLLLAAGAGVVALTYGLSPYRNYQLATMAAYLCATAGLTVLVGLSGQLSLGHGALMAVGAYACALSSAELGDRGTTGPLLLLVPLAAAVLAAAVVGGVVGLAGARLHGPYLAGLTLTLTIVVPAITTTFASRLGGDQGLSVLVEPAPAGLGATFPLERWQAWIACGAALLTVFLLANLVHGRFGREMRAVRDDEVAARLAGIDVGRTKVVVFVVSAATAGLGGGILAVLTQAVSPGAFSLAFSLFLLMAVVIGGIGHLAGAVWGALLLVALPELTGSVADRIDASPALAERLDGNLSLLVFGLVLVLVTIVFPRGIHGLVSTAYRRRRPRTPDTLPGSTAARPSIPTSTESIDA